MILFCLGVCAQTTRGTIGGVVTGALGPSVKLIHEDTGRVREGGSEFLFTLLPPGDYRLEASATGYQTQIHRVSLQLDQEVRFDIPLAKATGESINVVATRGLLKPESASLGATIEQRLIQGLPLDGRNFLELSLLVPGAVPAAQGSAASARGDFALNVSGGREDANNFVLDGVYNGDPKLNTAGVVPSVDAIREFEILTSTYDASFGRNAGAQVNVVTRSGSNRVHGTAYEFFRNGALDARNFFVPASEPNPVYQRNQFGFSAGGPVKKNKTFLFGDYEGRRSREGITRVTNVPTALERTGDFSQSGLPFLIDPFTQQPFPGNRIPRERLHPIGLAIANLYPLPNRNAAGQNFVSSPVSRDRNDQMDVRLDQQLGKASDLSIRYSLGDRLFYEPFAASFAVVPGYGNNVPRRAQNVMASETHAFTPLLLNEFRAGFSRVALGVQNEVRNGTTNEKFGLPVINGNPRDAGLTLFNLPGYSPIGNEYNSPQHSVTNTFQVNDAATWAKGRGIFKFGFDFRHLQQNAFRDVLARGFINFVGFTGSPVADLLQGLPAFTGVARLDNPQYLRSSSVSFFVNDSWRMTPRLTLDFGVRYEYNQPPADKYDRANLYDPAQGRLVPTGKNGFPRAGYYPDKNNIAPRFGFAWEVRPNTMLRGGYGIYFDQSSLAPGEGLYFSPPYYDSKIFFALPTFPLLLHNPFPSDFPIPVPGTATAFQRDLRTPYVQHWNINVQRQLGTDRVIEIGYAGSKGSKLISARDINQPAPSAAPLNPRPNPRFDDINVVESRANSNYHALQTRFQQRFAQGLSAFAGYTWSKSIDDASSFFSSAGDPNYPQDSRNVRLERGRSNFDVRHRLTLSYVYDLPFGKGPWFSGWQTSGIWSFQTGRPFTVALLPDNDNSGTGRSTLGFGANDRPNYLRNAELSKRTPERWFDTSAFAISPKGTFGNAGRNILDGPGMQSINASLVKIFKIREGMELQFRTEFFNLLNHTNFELPDNFLGSPTFGRISSALSPRHTQFGLKLVF